MSGIETDTGQGIQAAYDKWANEHNGVGPEWHDDVMTFLQPVFEANGLRCEDETSEVVLEWYTHYDGAFQIREVAKRLLVAFRTTRPPFLEV